MKQGKYTEQIKKAVEQMGGAGIADLKMCGYSMREIEKAVADGAIRWTRDGRLEVA